jgi:hypothetical protein
MERVGGREEKVEEHCSTGQSPQWAVVPMEEEEEEIIEECICRCHISYSLLPKRVQTTSGFYFASASTLYPLCCTESSVYLRTQKLKYCNITAFILRNVTAAICLCGGFSDQFSALAIHHARAAKHFSFLHASLTHCEPHASGSVSRYTMQRERMNVAAAMSAIRHVY